MSISYGQLCCNFISTQPLSLGVKVEIITMEYQYCGIFIRFLLKVNVNKLMDKWDKVFKNGPRKICGRQPLICLCRPYPFRFFKGCLPQMLLGPFLNTLSQMMRLSKLCEYWMGHVKFPVERFERHRDIKRLRNEFSEDIQRLFATS